MKTSLRRTTIFQALQSLSTVISKKASLPCLSMVHIKSEGDKVSVSGTNLDASLTIDLEAAGTEAGETLAPAKMLKDILNSAPKDAVIHLSSEVDEKGQHSTTLEFGKSSYSAYGLDAIEFPTLPEVEGVAFDTGDMANILNRVVFAASTEESRPMLNSVYFNVGEHGTYAVATNGHVMARYHVSAAPGDTPSFIVPAKELKAASKWGYTEVGSQGRFCVLRHGNANLTIRTLEGPYPNYQQVIPRDNFKTFTTNRKALEAAAKRLSMVASGQSGRVKLVCDDRYVSLSTENPEIGNATETLDGTYEDKVTSGGIAIGFNVRYLLNILKRFKGDTVSIKMHSPERAAVIESDGDLDYMCLLMPLRVV